MAGRDSLIWRKLGWLWQNERLFLHVQVVVTPMSERRWLEFTLPPRFSLPEMAGEGFPFRLRLLQQRPLGLTCYDSFDGRLHEAGFDYAVEDAWSGRASLCYRSGGERCEALPLSAVPRFAGDLPQGRWHDRLAKALDVRALLKRAELRGERCEWAVEDDSGERVAGLVRDTLALVLPGESRVRLAPRLRLMPEEAHDKAFGVLAEWLRTIPDIRGVERSYPGEVRWLTGQEAVASPARPAMVGEMRADAAVKQALYGLFEVLRLNEPGVLAETDTEFLHDYRVAVRRTRSVLRQMPGVFPDRVMERFSRQFASLAQATGESRDMDVYLMALDRLEADFPPSLQGSLGPLRELIRAHAVSAHESLNHYLGSSACRRLMARWEAFLAKPCPRRPVAENALRPVGELASHRIWKLYRRLLKEGAAITEASPADALHELRKTAKKLRYMMDQFHDLYASERMASLIRSLKSLQSLLGDYQDSDVQIKRLEAFADELYQRGAPVSCLLGIGVLLGRLHDREAHLRGDFEACFARFSRRGQQKKFRRLFLEPIRTDEGQDTPVTSDG